MTLKRVLHVDDDDDIRAVAKVALEVVGGFTVLQCASGADALKRAETFAPDLVLLDVMMPGLDGEQTFHLLRKVSGLATSPIIFATAKVHQQSVDRLLAVGAAGVVAKPFDPMELPSLLRKFWDQSRSESDR